MTLLHLLKLGLVYTILTLSDNLVSGNTECPLTDADFERGRDIDVSLQKSEGRDFHERGGANYQGDIDLTPEQYEVIVEGKPKGRALTLIGHWPREGAVVNIPYIITACDFTDDEKANVARAIEEYKEKTCLRFIPRTDEEDYINISRGSGCSSALGKKFGEQLLKLAAASDGYLPCASNVGVPIHELMHAIGYLHEQSRKDRDDYVTIHWDNMDADPQNVNWKKCEHCDLQNSTYDFNSVMHYGAKAFSNNGEDTITTKNGESIGQRNGFSDLDIKGINDLYCGKCVGAGCWMNVGCCNEVEVTGLTTDAANREGTYVKQEGTYYDRDVYKKVDSEMYIHWDGYRWTIDIDLDKATFQTAEQQTLNADINSPLDQNNPGCELVAGNQCPTVCGGTWKEWRSGWKLAPSISVTCKVNTAHCNNTVQDSDETGVDCGGVSCPTCPDAVDGGWGTWSSWTKCNAKCPKANGKEMRRRECDNPVPEKGGKACVGDEKEEKDCKITCAVDGGWGKWSQWSKCNAKCPKTSGKQVRTRKCNKPAPGDGGKDCVGTNKGERSCKIKCSTTPCKETCKNKNKKCSSCKKNKCKSKKVQKQCPITCNKCKSGGSGGNTPCKDKAGAKKCKKDKKKCKTNKKVQKNCAKTCKKCK